MEKEEAGLRPVMLPFLRMYLSDFQYFSNKSVLFYLIRFCSVSVKNHTELIKDRQTKQTFIEKNDKNLENIYKCTCENDEKGI